MFEKYGVFTAAELHSRHEVYLAEFRTRTRIEGELALTMSRTILSPAVSRHLSDASGTVEKLAAVGLTIPEANDAVRDVASLFSAMLRAERALESELRGNDSELIRGRLEALRVLVDRLEKLIDDSLWPLPKYREMLFVY